MTRMPEQVRHRLRRHAGFIVLAAAAAAAVASSESGWSRETEAAVTVDLAPTTTKVTKHFTARVEAREAKAGTQLGWNFSFAGAGSVSQGGASEQIPLRVTLQVDQTGAMPVSDEKSVGWQAGNLSAAVTAPENTPFTAPLTTLGLTLTFERTDGAKMPTSSARITGKVNAGVFSLGSDQPADSTTLSLVEDQ